MILGTGVSKCVVTSDGGFLVTLTDSVSYVMHKSQGRSFLNSLVGKDVCSQSYVLHVSGAAMDTILV